MVKKSYVQRIADKIFKTENLHLKVFRLEPLEPPVVGPCLPDQGHAEVELVQVMQDLVHPRHHLGKNIKIYKPDLREGAGEPIRELSKNLR